ncbi:MAG: GHMP kinase [Chitinispirillia bacterium]|jgi:glucuronokinase
MIIIRKQAYARAGLLGNPSDGYNGKTISFLIRDFFAEVILYEWDTLDIVMAENDKAKFTSIYHLTNDVKQHGYYGGIRLVKAAIKRFAEYCIARNINLHSNNFSIRYSTTIPRQVGMAGSSAIIVATLRCLMEFYNVSIPLNVQPSFVLSIEQEELGISGGLQDRVIQVYEGMVYMDFSKQQEHTVDGFLCYHYEQLPVSLLPQLYVAYHDSMSEPTEFFHNDIRGRFDRGEIKVVEAMNGFASIAYQGRKAIIDQDHKTLFDLINKNFALRKTIYSLAQWQINMVETAHQCGASAKFAGSGGAIVGMCTDDIFKSLQVKLGLIGSKVFKPRIQSDE